MQKPKFKGSVLAFTIDEQQSLSGLVTECGYKFEDKVLKQASKCYDDGYKVTVVRPNPKSLMIEIETNYMCDLDNFMHDVLQDFIKIGLHLYED